jgi:glycosyltransferase involved in cell wall biosynthesis
VGNNRTHDKNKQYGGSVLIDGDLMKIAMVSPFPEQRNLFRGGVEAAASVLAEGLRDLGQRDIHVIAPSAGVVSAMEERDGMTLHWLPKGKLPGVIDYWSLFRHKLHKLLREIQPDITHFQGMAGWTLGYNAPYVFTVHGITEKDIDHQSGHLVKLRRAVYAFVERRGRRRSPHTIVISPYVLDQIGSQIPGKRYSIENPVDADAFKVRRNSELPQVLYVGQINKRKNVGGLIQAFALLKARSPNATLRIVGELNHSDYVNQCRRMVHQYDLQESVRFLGKADRKMLLNELSQAACLALVSMQETAPIIVEEAMAAGVPVVASKICGLPYFIQDGITGFLVDQNDPQHIAEKLHLILSDTLRANEMGEKARSIALNRFHTNAVAQRTLDVYRSILSETGGCHVAVGGDSCS